MSVTQRDIALALDISQAAVSRALRNDHRMAKTTRAGEFELSA